MNFTIKMIATILAFSGFSAMAQEEEAGTSRTFPKPFVADTRAEMKPSLGINTGIASTSENYDDTFGYGIEYGLQKYVPYGVALELSGYSADGDDNQAAITRTKLLAKLNYNFGGSIPVIRESYVGLGAGPVLDNIDGSSEIQVGFLPQLGFDIPLSDTRYTLGANANYMFVTGDNPDAFAMNGVAKYWF